MGLTYSSYVLSLIEKLNSCGFHAEKSYISNTIEVKNNEHSVAYLFFRVRDDKTLVLISEYYLKKITSKDTLRIISDVTINEPHCDNIMRLVNLYFETGKGADPKNPTIAELINATKNNVKSART